MYQIGEIKMINITKIFNNNYNILLYFLSFITITYQIYKKEIKNTGILLIKISAILTTITIPINKILKLLINNYLYIFIKPIINNIQKNILTLNILTSIIGCLLIILNKKMRKNLIFKITYNYLFYLL